MSQYFGGPFFGGEFYSASEGSYYGGPFYAGGFFGNVTPAATPSAGGGGYNPYTYSRGTGRLRFDLPTLPLPKKPKGKKRKPQQDEAVAYIEYLAKGLELQPSPPYVAELLMAFRAILAQQQLADEERHRMLMIAFLEMEEDEREAEMLLLSS